MEGDTLWRGGATPQKPFKFLKNPQHTPLSTRLLNTNIIQYLEILYQNINRNIFVIFAFFHVLDVN